MTTLHFTLDLIRPLNSPTHTPLMNGIIAMYPAPRHTMVLVIPSPHQVTTLACGFFQSPGVMTNDNKMSSEVVNTTMRMLSRIRQYLRKAMSLVTDVSK